MYIVLLGGEPHSAWATVAEAVKQIEILKDKGYGRRKKLALSYVFVKGLKVKNGHYYQ